MKLRQKPYTAMKFHQEIFQLSQNIENAHPPEYSSLVNVTDNVPTSQVHST